MRRRYPISVYIIIGLIAIGIMVSLDDLIIPIVVLGLIFLLYKFPPSRWSQLRSFILKRKPGKINSKKAKFRVIKGNKDQDEDRPRYH